MSLFGCYICGHEGHKDPDCPERGERHVETIGVWMFQDLILRIVREWDDWESGYWRETTYRKAMRDGHKKDQVVRQYIPDEHHDKAVAELNRIWWSLHRPATDDDAHQLTLEGT